MNQQNRKSEKARFRDCTGVCADHLKEEENWSMLEDSLRRKWYDVLGYQKGTVGVGCGI